MRITVFVPGSLFSGIRPLNGFSSFFHLHHPLGSSVRNRAPTKLKYIHLIGLDETNPERSHLLSCDVFKGIDRPKRIEKMPPPEGVSKI